MNPLISPARSDFSQSGSEGVRPIVNIIGVVKPGLAKQPVPVKMSRSENVIYAAIAGDIAVAISKFVAATFTGSSAMLAEGFHSLVDTGNELLLLIGIQRSRRAADEGHAFGYGKVTYFWALIVALSVFSLGVEFPSIRVSSVCTAHQSLRIQPGTTLSSRLRPFSKALVGECPIES
ncbi:cation diffusion facilitator family transporter [Candidatus Contendibacter odensensis]|uniref:cation diffusion facilitator family transporter n=1 Tax=Candidatus Contendibacter odensensis TaxID=1400860 RepID=UPI002A4E2346|nr:cation transporter [Candidatus Contendobacter odensis]